MKKRLISALLALTLALSLAACGGNGTDAGSGSSSSAESSADVSGAASSQPMDENLDEEGPEEDAEAQPEAQPDEDSAPQPEAPATGTAKPSGGASSGTSKPSGGTSSGTSKPSGGTSSGTSKPSGGTSSGTSKPSGGTSSGTSKPSGGASSGTEKPSGSGGSSSATSSVDLKKFYDDTIAAMTDAPGMAEVTSDLLDGVYPGLSALKPKQTVAYMAMISAVACEVTALELSNAEDAKSAADILRARIKQQGEDQGAFYPQTVDQWKNHSQVIVNGNYVLMAVGVGNETFAANFNALTK